jgi:hypothetical protein
MSAPAKETKPDFDEEFLQTLKEWREKHKIRDDDAVHLLVEMFRIHQKHWDAVRLRQMPSLDQFRSNVTAATESAQMVREQMAILIEALETHPNATPVETIPKQQAVYAVTAAVLGGLLIGIFIGRFLL